MIESSFQKSGKKIYDASGDYAGIGRAQIGIAGAAARTRELLWVAKDIVTGEETLRQTFGRRTAKPFTGCDFDGDGRTDLATVQGVRVTIRNSADGTISTIRLPRYSRLIDMGCGDTSGDAAYEITMLAIPKKAKTLLGRPDKTPYLIQIDSSGHIVSKSAAPRKAKGIVIAAINPESETELAGSYVRLGARANQLTFSDANGKTWIFRVPAFKDVSTVTVEDANGDLSDALLIASKKGISLVNLAGDPAVTTFDSNLLSGSLVHSQSAHLK